MCSERKTRQPKITELLLEILKGMRPQSRPNRGSDMDLCWERNEKETSEQNK